MRERVSGFTGRMGQTDPPEAVAQQKNHLLSPSLVNFHVKNLTK